MVQAPTKKVAAPAKKSKTATVANPLFQSKPKSFRIGGDLRVSRIYTKLFWVYYHVYLNTF